MTPWTHPLQAGLPTNGAEIEARSLELIDGAMATCAVRDEDRPVVRRIVHATADPSIAESIRVHPEAVSRGIKALQNGNPVVADVRMVCAGCTRVETICAISDPAVIAESQSSGQTRAACAMRVLAEHIDGGIVAIGNAPTAIWSLLELHATTGLTPALVVGLPVGFVGASESKQALWESGLPCITNDGPRGGSPWAAAVINHLCRELAKLH